MIMALQTKVNIKQAFGIAGEFFDDSPRRTASYVVGADSVFGTFAFLNSATGLVGPYTAGTYTTLAGLFVRPKEAVIRNALLAHAQAIATAVENGKTVRLSGLGTFKHSERKAMTARNPRTGQTYQKPETKTVRFSVSQTLKDAVK